MTGLDRTGLRNWARVARNVAVHMRKHLRHVAATAYVHPTAEVSRDLVAGDYAFVAPWCKLDPGVQLGRYVMLARGVAIVGDDHVWDVPGAPMQFSGRPPQSTTEIHDDAWVGFRAVVMRGVTIGRGAIVAAHAVVTEDVEPYAVVAGIPARRIKDRFPDPADRAVHDAMLDGPTVPPSFAGRLDAPGVAGSGRGSMPR